MFLHEKLDPGIVAEISSICTWWFQTGRRVPMASSILMVLGHIPSPKHLIVLVYNILTCYYMISCYILNPAWSVIYNIHSTGMRAAPNKALFLHSSPTQLYLQQTFWWWENTPWYQHFLGWTIAIGLLRWHSGGGNPKVWLKHCKCHVE